MTHAIRVHEHGGPEVLKWEKIELGDPGPGEVKIHHKAVGLNYIDVYFRTGLIANACFAFRKAYVRFISRRKFNLGALGSPSRKS